MIYFFFFLKKAGTRRYRHLSIRAKNLDDKFRLLRAGAHFYSPFCILGISDTLNNIAEVREKKKNQNFFLCWLQFYFYSLWLRKLARGKQKKQKRKKKIEIILPKYDSVTYMASHLLSLQFETSRQIAFLFGMLTL